MKSQSKLFQSLLLLLISLVSVLALLIDNVSADAASFDDMRNEIRQDFTSVDASIVKVHINGWAKVQCAYTDYSTLHEKAEEILSILGESAKVRIHSDSTDNYKRAVISTQIDGADYTIQIYHSNSTYVIAEVQLGFDSPASERLAYEKLEHILNKYERFPVIGTTYVATIPRRLEKIEMENTAKKIFNNLDADITEVSQDNKWISITGYSRRINTGFESENGRFNLNIALRHHSNENKTLIYLGTPVISIPY